MSVPRIGPPLGKGAHAKVLAALSDDFRIYMPVSTWEKSGDEHSMRIGGIVSTDTLDRQGEKVVQDGLDFAPFLSSGWYNDNHGQRTSDVLGYPTTVRRVRKGEALPNGEVSQCNGWWSEGYLLDTEEGRRVYALAQSLTTAEGRRLGFSIEGKVTRRDNRDRTKIVSAEVRNVAITHCPVNTDTHMHALAKALIAGAAVSAPGAPSPGNGFALRTESLDRKRTKSEGEDPDDPEVAHLSDGGDGGEPNNGGFAGTNPHLGKAEPQQDDLDIRLRRQPRQVSTFEYVSEWSDALADARDNDADNIQTLTKSEASIIVSARFPHLTAREIDHLVDLALGSA